MKRIYLFVSLFLALLIVSCNDDDDTTTPVAGEITGGPYDFCVDGVADMVGGISLNSSSSVGTNSTWVITDEAGIILGIPPTLEKVEEVNFDDAGTGICKIWYLRYEDGLVGAEMDLNANDLEGKFDLSNAIIVNRKKTVAGVLSGGPYQFTVDNTADFATDLSLDSTNATGSNSTFIITDDTGIILGMPPTLEDAKGVDFNDSGVGVCLIWYLRYEDGIVGLEKDLNANDLEGCFNLSNSIQVTRSNPNF